VFSMDTVSAVALQGFQGLSTHLSLEQARTNSYIAHKHGYDTGTTAVTV
jgi:hypothetical protein